MKAELTASSPSAPPRRACSTSPTRAPTRRSGRCCWPRPRAAWSGSACPTRTPTSCWRTSPSGSRPGCSRRRPSSTRPGASSTSTSRASCSDFDLPLDWRLSQGFRRRVLRAIARIPYGQTRSYTEMAQQRRQRARRARRRHRLRLNPIPIVVPCHRVLRSGGGLGGYGGGLPMKRGAARARGRARAEPSPSRAANAASGAGASITKDQLARRLGQQSRPQDCPPDAHLIVPAQGAIARHAWSDDYRGCSAGRRRRSAASAAANRQQPLDGAEDFVGPKKLARWLAMRLRSFEIRPDEKASRETRALGSACTATPPAREGQEECSFDQSEETEVKPDDSRIRRSKDCDWRTSSQCKTAEGEAARSERLRRTLRKEAGI